jgi:hypothetical protein
MSKNVWKMLSLRQSVEMCLGQEQQQKRSPFYRHSFFIEEKKLKMNTNRKI